MREVQIVQEGVQSDILVACLKHWGNTNPWIEDLSGHSTGLSLPARSLQRAHTRHGWSLFCLLKFMDGSLKYPWQAPVQKSARRALTTSFPGAGCTLRMFSVCLYGTESGDGT